MEAKREQRYNLITFNFFLGKRKKIFKGIK